VGEELRFLRPHLEWNIPETTRLYLQVRPKKKNGEVRRIRHFCGVRRDHLREHLARPVPVARMPGLEVEEEAFSTLRIQLQLCH
jgi:hypothetical protein